MSESIDNLYKSLLLEITTNGYDKPDRTGTGCRSVNGLSLDYDMSKGFPLISIKKTFFKGILRELLWFVSGNTNIYPLIKNGVNIWTDDCYREFVKRQRMENVPDENIPNKGCFVDLIKDNVEFRAEFGDLGPVYGAQWTNFISPAFKVDEEDFETLIANAEPWETYKVLEEYKTALAIYEVICYKTTNQLEQVLYNLKNNPYSRRHLVTAWNPGELNAMALPPCHYSFQFFVRPNGNGAPYLDLLWNQRSVDVGLGLPFNIASYATLLQMYCSILDYIPGKLMFRGGDVHLYNNHRDRIQPIFPRLTKSTNNPLLIIDKSKTYTSLLDFKYEDFKLVGYDPHPTIKLELST